ncbi:Chitinase [Minicystis rosea]|nr:Chitinase [Minicystis rosea]
MRLAPSIPWLFAFGAAAASGCAGASTEQPSPAVGEPAAQAGAPGNPKGAGNNLIKNGTFDDGTSLPWTTSFSAPADGKATIEKGAFCLRVENKGTNAWDAQMRHREMVIQKGHTYTIHFKAWATEPTRARPKLGMAGPPYAEYWAAAIDLSTTPQTYAAQFTMGAADDATAELTFHLGGNLAKPSGAFSVCIDDVHLDDPQFTPPVAHKAPPVPKVRVNQVGYFPGLNKRAIVSSPSSSPLKWEVISSSGSVVASGDTLFNGRDAASGEQVHLVDFTAMKATGEGFKLRVGEETSYPFSVGRGLYKKLKYDALAYFYHNRSGIPIAMPHAGEVKWARPAGHLSDKSIPCAPGSGCSYSLDVTGGWYDAGDHGKYVVNGGISVWTMLNQFERGKLLGKSSADFGDGKLNIPENKNGAPDILDEARVEIEFMLKMQVPEGNPLAGMVHHKVHDEKWTALGLPPHEDPMKRFLRPPSTAATLNVAATAAQAARIWKTIDPAFSAKCLTAAERAWTAAQAHPDVFAPGSDNSGGGPYDDREVTDEFYWAAAELFATTGKDVYKTFHKGSPHAKSIPSATAGNAGGSSMTWQVTQALGAITLAIVPHGDAQATAAARATIVAAADSYLDVIETQGYRLPFKPGAGSKYPWGSNSFVLNNLVILALAHDITGKQTYLDGVVEGMDYILGRNPLAQSYVTGYGANPLRNPHHRFWAHQVDAKFPVAPPGAVSGGPNSGLEDPYVQAAGLKGCAPQKCFVDNIEAWSVNEITINWNAPLAWVAAFLDEKGK